MMAQRYVRFQTATTIHYGLLEANRAVQVLDAPPWLKGQPSNQVLEPDGYQLLAPCAPSKVVAVGKNYTNHAVEMGTPVPQEPLLFLKPSTTVLGPERGICYPPQSQQVDYEGELAVVIGEYCSKCPLEEAQAKIWGYTIANDITARDLQKRDSQWTRAKGFDTFCPLGPWIVREHNPSASLQTFVNNRLVQNGCLDQMVFLPNFLISYISHVMTLLPGDVVLTGTPAGVGPLQVGDRVRVEIEGIGALENPVVGPQRT